MDPPARIGDPLELIASPSLVVDLDLLEANLDCMSNFAHAAGVRLRPHAKAHKCVEIAQAQIKRGAVGVCCQTVAEAELFVNAGIGDVLVTNEIVEEPKLRRLAQLSAVARVTVCVDHPEHVRLLTRVGAGASLNVLVEIDVGQRRCGTEPGEAAADLAASVLEVPGLAFAGLQAYHGSAQHFRTVAERRDAIAQATDDVKRTLACLDARGIPCSTVTGGGTGTFGLEARSGVWTELQPGSYALMDADYARNTPAEGDPHFAHALELHTHVISAARARHAVLNGGLKSLSVDAGPPRVAGAEHADAEVVAVSDEHTVLRLTEGQGLAIGTRVALIPGHVDPTVNLHRWLVGVRQGIVEALWPTGER